MPATPNIFLPCLQTPINAVNFPAAAAQSAAWLVGELVSDGTQNAEVSFDFYSEAGTYDLILLHRRNTNRGIYTLQVDGATVATVDGYSGSASAIRTVTSGVVLTDGQHRLRVLMATKNASSSSFFGAFSAFLLTKTA